MRTIDILRTGLHRDMKGSDVALSEADLDQVVAGYDPALHEAPIVIGHPTADAPAYGWVKGLTRQGDVLQAAADQIDPAFAELVGAGRYKKVSASLYRPTSPNNPTPGAWYLRHVGFLGAQPPAVKGLGPVSLAGGDEDLLTIELADLADAGDRLSARIFRSLRDFFLAEFGQEKADKALPSWLVNDAQESAAQPEGAPAFAESAAEVARRAELDRREAELEAREATLATQDRARRTQEHVAFVEGVLRDGRAVPRDAAVAILRSLDGETVELAEGVSALDQARALIASWPREVEFGEHAPRDTDDLADDGSVALAEQITTYIEDQRRNGRHVTATEALAHIRRT